MSRSSHRRSYSTKWIGLYKKPSLQQEMRGKDQVSSWKEKIDGLTDLIEAFDRFIKAITKLLLRVLWLITLIYSTLVPLIYKT